MTTRIFKGLVAASYTPMHEDESIAPEVIAPLVDYAVRQRFAGLFAIGSTGEFPSLTMQERKTVAEVYIREAAGRIPVIVNVGSCSFRESAELAAHAAAAGADAICAIAPFYFRPETVRDLAEFIKRIAPACDGRPLYLYHAPGITGVNLPMSEFVKIMLDEVPNFAGIKFTNENLCEFERCAALGKDRIQMMFGRDEMLLGALAMGAQAGVGTTFNYLPKIYRRPRGRRHGKSALLHGTVPPRGRDFGPLRAGFNQGLHEVRRNRRRADALAGRTAERRTGKPLPPGTLPRGA